MKIDIKRLTSYHGIGATSELTALTLLRECVYYLQHNNKNTTKKQDQAIDTIAAIVDSIKA